jgi:uncharacterized membrane protein YcjF (UPF0283 family)
MPINISTIYFHTKIQSIWEEEQNMASAVKDSATEKIEIVDLPEEEEKKKGIGLWIAAIVGLALVVGVVTVLRRFLAPAEEM